VIEEAIDTTPGPGFIRSIRADNQPKYWGLIGEGVDNAFDAGAEKIRILLEKEFIEIADDGAGVTRDRVLAMVKLGQHGEMTTTRLGRYGVGIKYQSISAGDLFIVESVSADGKLQVRANWGAAIKSDQWPKPVPKWTPVEKKFKTGTTIRIENLLWKPPTEKDVDTVREKLQGWFYPAIEMGAEIILNGELLSALIEPEITDGVSGEIYLEKNKYALVRGGILAGENKKSRNWGINLTYKHRAIKAQSSFGCGSYSGHRGLFARVDLHGSWGLSRFKDDLSDNDDEELENRTHEILKPILEKCYSATMDLRAETMEALLNERIPPEFRPARPPRKKPQKENEEDVKNKKPHGETKEGEEKPNAPARKRMTSRSFIISFEEDFADEYGLGKFERGRPSRIMLSKDCPLIQQFLDLRGTELGAQALLAIAAMIYQHENERPDQMEFDFMGSFGLRAWKMANWK